MSEERFWSGRTDEELIEAARGGDRQAFGALWGRHSDAGRRVARSITQTFDADDLVSEAYLKIFAAVTAGGGPAGPFRPYLFVTIRNQAVTWARRRREQTLEEADDIPDPRATDAAVLAALDSGLTLRAFRSLPERWQEVLWFTEVDALTPAEIAVRLGLRANSVAALAYRAREGLRQAWIQAHIDTAAAGTEHAWVLSRVGKNARGALSTRNAARFEAHLADCPACTVIADEAVDASRRFTSVLLPLAVGITGTAGLGAFIGLRAQGNGDGAAEAQGSGRRTGVSRRASWLVPTAVLAVALIGSGVGYAITVAPPTTSGGDRSRSEADATPSASSPTTPTPSSPAPQQPVTASPRQSSVPGAAPHTRGSDLPTAVSPSVPAPDTGAVPVPVEPVIVSVDTGGGVLLPVVTGTARPATTVIVRIGPSSTATAVGADGSWRTAPVQVAAGTYTATATADGVTAPSKTVTVQAPVVSLSSTAQSVVVTVRGQPGTTYVVRSDAGTSVQVTAGSDGTAHTTIPQTSHPMTVSVHAASGARIGPATSITTR